MLITAYTAPTSEPATTTISTNQELETPSSVEAAELETEILSPQPKHQRLIARWEVVSGKLTCVWLTELS